MFKFFPFKKFSRPIISLAPKRNMGGGGHAKGPAPEGFEGQIRKYLPENHHVSMAIMGLYFSLYMFSKLLSGGKKSAPAVAAASTGVSDGAIPSFDSPEFSSWISTEGNIEKYLTSA